MEKVQEHRHMCKLCNKSFPCGRSLGGHMRSHVINDQTHQNSHRTKLKSVNNCGFNQNPNYTLRDNPKRSYRLADSSRDDDKLCRQCGKGFQSWKALFGHMKCHSGKFSNEESEISMISANRELATDGQSDNEIDVPNKKRKRSQRDQTRYKDNVNSSLSIANIGSNSSVSEIEQEEEVAICLIMLSKDSGYRSRGFSSVAESSDNNFELLEVGSSTKIKKTKHNGSLPIAKFLKLRNREQGSENSPSQEKKQMDFGCKERKLRVSLDGYFRENNGFDDGVNLCSEKRSSSNNRRDPWEKLSCRDWDNEMRNVGSEKKSMFECTSCNKTFDSYQALGGHRASHKKLKGCFVSNIGSSENSTEKQIITDSTSDTKSKPLDNESVVFEPQTSRSSQKKNSNAHFECPICFKVFSSGQALGGHMRSHLIAGSESRSNPISVIQNSTPEVRDFLDLNLPARAEEEEAESSGFKPWLV